MLNHLLVFFLGYLVFFWILPPGRLSSYLYFPVVCCGFIKFFPQFEGDLRVLEGTFRFDVHFIPIDTYTDSRLC